MAGRADSVDVLVVIHEPGGPIPRCDCYGCSGDSVPGTARSRPLRGGRLHS